MAEEDDNIPVASLAMVRLRHFLYLGAEGNLCKPGKPKFIPENVLSIATLIDEGKGPEVVQEIIRFHKEGHCIHPEAVAFALAVCCHSTHQGTKTAALYATKDICQAPSSMFAFMRFNEQLATPTTGWGRAHRKFVISWYNDKDGKDLAVNVTKVKSRHQWTHKDVLCLAHVKPKKTDTAAVLKYIVKGLDAAEKEFGDEPDAQAVLTYLKGVHELKHTSDQHLASRLIEIHDLCYEHIPTSLLKSKEMWSCLIPRLQLHTLLQQLPRLNKLGLLKINSPHLKALLERLRSENVVAEENVGPLDTFLAIRQWEASNRLLPGRSLFRQNVPQLDEALLNLHLESFTMVPSTGKKYLVAVDVRSTMSHTRTSGCSSMSPSDASGVVLMALARAEVSNVTAIGFSTTEMVNFDINNKMTLADIVQRMRNIPMGPVNLTAPIQWALDKKKAYDVIIIFTDNQTAPGDIHPAEILKEYRKSLNLPNARFIVCALGSREFSLAPPEESGMLDIAGFNVKLLQVIQDFAQGVF